MRRLVCAALAQLAVAGPALAQEPQTPPAAVPESGSRPAYRSFALATRLTESFSSRQEAVFSYGRTKAFGPAESWMIRLEAALGVATGVNFIDGAYVGPQLGVAAALWGLDYPENNRTQLMVLGGGAGYLAYDLPDKPDETAFAPAYFVGLAVRTRPVAGRRAGLGFNTIEVVREERFGGWEKRWFLRVGFGSAPSRAGRGGAE